MFLICLPGSSNQSHGEWLAVLSPFSESMASEWISVCGAEGWHHQGTVLIKGDREGAERQNAADERDWAGVQKSIQEDVFIIEP